MTANIIKYVGKSQYSFCIPEDTVEKEVHWYLMSAGSYYSKPQREEYFVDSGFYKFHEAYHLLRFQMKDRFWKRLIMNTWFKKSKSLGKQKVFLGEKGLVISPFYAIRNILWESEST